jgi:hypothetical protein
MAKRTNRQSQYAGKSRTPDIPNMREQRHEIAAKYYLACRSSQSKQNNDVLGKGATYINAINLKVNKDQIGSLRTVYGSVIKFEIDQELGDGFIPAAGTVVNNMFFVVWLDNTGVSPKNYITLNDKIVLETDNLGFTKDNHIDISESNNSLGGEVFLTDYNIRPIYLMIKDMLDNYGVTDKYTTAFDISQHTLNTDVPLNQIIFKGLYLTGALNGLATGSYAYSYRLVSNSGDKSNWSPATPLIQVTDKPAYYPLSEVDIDGAFTGAREYNERLASGQLPADINISQCGCELWLRIDNRLGYNEVEISRTEYNVGAGLDTTGQTVLIQKILIQPGDFFILVIKDDKSTQTSDTIISIDEESSINSIIKRAKTIRYFNNKAQLGNIEYENPRATGDAQISLEGDADGDKTIPLTHYNYRRQVYGMIDEQFRTYNKSLMDEEVYGFAVVVWGDSMSRINVIEPSELKSITLPSRDTKKTLKEIAFSANTSLSGIDIDMDNNNGSIGNIAPADAYDLADNFDEVVFYTGVGRVPVPKNNYLGDKFNWNNPIIYPFPNSWYADISKTTDNLKRVEDYDTVGSYGSAYENDKNNYKEPVNRNSNKVYPYNPMFQVSNVGDPSFPSIFDFPEDYIEPFSKNPYVRSLCLGITRLKINDNNIKAVSIVRTKPAGRVIAQGLCTYDFIPGEGTGPYSISHYKKKKSSFTFLCPDNWLLGEDIISVLKSDPGRFRIKISRPQNFTTEVMAVSAPDENGGASAGPTGYTISKWISDIICHPYYDKVNPVGGGVLGLPRTGKTNYMGTGSQDNAKLGNGDIESGFIGWEIESYEEVFEEEGVVKVIININTDGLGLYKTEEIEDADDSTSLNMLEPIYIANIIDTNASVPSSDVKDFYNSSSLIKMESVVEVIKNSRDYLVYRIYTVDERDEDFHLEKTFVKYMGFNTNLDRYIYVKEDSVYHALWNVNCFGKSPAEYPSDSWSNLLLNISFGIGTPFRDVPIKGVYSTERDSNGNLYINLKPQGFYTGYPEAEFGFYYNFKENSEIVVKFDNTQPIKCFGENYIGANTALQYNRLSKSEALDSDPLILGRANFPYKYFRLARNLVMNYNDVSLVGVHGEFGLIRQMAWRFFCKSKTASVLSDGKAFPNTQYKPRLMPKGMAVSFDPDAYTLLDEDYESKFPGERERWNYGGFNPNQLNHNIDYSKRNENYKYASFNDRTPGSNNKNLYPTRVIWSLTRPIQSYYSSGLRTFRPFSYKDLDDKNSQIVKLFDHISNSGANLMAFTEEALYLLLTNKRVLTGASDEVVTTSIDETDYIPQVVQVPSQSNSGLPFGFEGTFAEGANCVCWANDSGVYLLKNGSVFPLHENAYLYILDFIKSGREAGMKFVSYLNAASDEYYLSYAEPAGSPPGEPPVEGEDGEEPPVEEEPLLIKGLMFSIADDKREYVSTITFKYSLFLVQKNMEHGIVKLENKCYIESLDDTGDKVALGIFEAQLFDAISQAESSFFHKEYIDIQVSSSREPTVVNTGGGSVAPFKYRGSWWSRVPRSDKKRYQSTAFDYMIEFFIRDRNDPERTYDDAVLNGFILHYKNLK